MPKVLPAVALLLLGLLASVASRACGPSFLDEWMDGFTLDPEVAASGQDGMASLLFDPSVPGFGRVADWGDHFHGQNLSEWQAWLGLDSAATAQWDTVLGAASPARVDSALAALEARGAMPHGWSAWALWRRPRERLVPALRYVRYARTAEAWSRKGGPGEGAPEPVPEVCETADPQDEARRARDPFLRQRWLFQAAKALFYGDPDSLPAFLAGRDPDLRGPCPSLWWRSRMHLAGVLRRSDTLRADLLYAQVALAFPPLREMAANDFLVREDGDWRRLLASAGNGQERAGLWFLAGLRAGDLAAADSLLRQDSANPGPAILLARFLAKAQFGPDTSLAAARGLASRLAPSRRTADPAYWNLVAAHLAPRSEAARSLALLDTAERRGEGRAGFGLQVRMSRVLVRLRAARTADTALEGFLVRTLPGIDTAGSPVWSGFDAAFRTEARRLWALEPELAWVLGRRVFDAPDTLARLSAFWHRPGRPFEELAKARARRKGLDERLADARLGTALLYHGRTAEAVRALERGAGEDSLGTDPFNAEISDDHDRDHERFRRNGMTRLGYAREVLRLEGLERGTGPEAAKAALRLGIGLYNRTSYGNARSLYGHWYGSEADWFGEMRRIDDLEPARRRFARAARDLPSAEGRAWATWLLAKCERDARHDGTPPTGSYALLRRQSAGTPFWRRALKECGWLRTWAQESASSPRP